MHLPFLLPVIICTLIKFEWSPLTSTLLSISNPFLGSRFLSNNTNSYFQLQQVWHHPRSTLVIKEFNGKIIFIVWITCSWMHSMIDSYFPIVSSKVFRFSSFQSHFELLASAVTHTHACAVNIYAPLYGLFRGLLLYCQNKPYINLISVVIWLCSILLFAQCSYVSSSSLRIPHRTHTVHCITPFMPNCYFSQSMYLTENMVCHKTKN